MKNTHFFYNSFKTNFMVGTTSSFCFYPSFPTNYINSYFSYPSPKEKDFFEISSDWKMIGYDITSAEKHFNRENKNGPAEY